MQVVPERHGTLGSYVKWENIPATHTSEGNHSGMIFYHGDRLPATPGPAGRTLVALEIVPGYDGPVNETVVHTAFRTQSNLDDGEIRFVLDKLYAGRA
jgi:hypothetical protein